MLRLRTESTKLRPDEDVDLADAAASAVGSTSTRCIDDEQRVAVLLDLGPLVAVARVFDGEFVQAELALHLVQLGRRWRRAARPRRSSPGVDVVADVFDRDVGQLVPSW